MPIYEYYCKQCNAYDELNRKEAAKDRTYSCPVCSSLTVRRPTKPNVVTKGEEIPYMHPAFGRMMTDSQAKAEAKRMGHIEVGNEDVGKHIGPTERKSYDSPDYFT